MNLLYPTFKLRLLPLMIGVYHSSDYSNWQELCWNLGVTDIPNFVRVAYIHNAGYIGGGIGLIVAIIYLLRLRKSDPGATGQPPDTSLK